MSLCRRKMFQARLCEFRENLPVQPVVIDKPYEFVAPYTGTFWVWLCGKLLRWYLRRNWGVESAEYRGLEHLQQSLAEGHGVVLASNHCRPCDPLVLGILSRAVNRPFYIMASWHVFFESGRLIGWLANRLGAFSVNRWAMDREAINAAITILSEAQRPLVLFPEGHITRTNDHLHSLLAGTSFLARSAARKRAKQGNAGKIIVHPVAIKYFFHGNVETAVTPILDEIETRLSWQKQTDLPLYDRIAKLGKAMLSLKEMEYFGEPQTGSLAARLDGLINRILQPLEAQWTGGRGGGDGVAERAKALRMAIVPELVAGSLTEPERQKRWRLLADIYLAQQLALYPPDYIAENPTPERILETVERFEEDLTDRARIHRPFHVVLQVAPGIEATAEHKRGGEQDPLLTELEDQLRQMLQTLAHEGRLSY